MSLYHASHLQPTSRLHNTTDRYKMGQSTSTQTTVTGVNDIPPPQFDANANAPPQKQHNRVIDFVRVSLDSRYQ